MGGQYVVTGLESLKSRRIICIQVHGGMLDWVVYWRLRILGYHGERCDV
jgi:hypothetical protein